MRFLIVDIRTNVPILSIQPFGNSEFDYAVKVRTMNVASHDDLQRMVSYQIKNLMLVVNVLNVNHYVKQAPFPL